MTPTFSVCQKTRPSFGRPQGILKDLQKFFGCGILTKASQRDGTVEFKVRKLDDILNIIIPPKGQPLFAILPPRLAKLSFAARERSTTPTPQLAKPSLKGGGGIPPSQEKGGEAQPSPFPPKSPPPPAPLLLRRMLRFHNIYIYKYTYIYMKTIEGGGKGGDFISRGGSFEKGVRGE